MSKLYGVIMNNTIVGVHEDISICNTYLHDVRINKNSLCSIVKLKKKHKNKDNIYDLYLIKYGDSFIPSKYYDAIEYEDNVIINDYREAKNTLSSLLNFITDDKEKKHISKTILTLEKHININKDSFMDTDFIDKIIEMRNEFLNIIK